MRRLNPRPTIVLCVIVTFVPPYMLKASCWQPFAHGLPAGGSGGVQLSMPTKRLLVKSVLDPGVFDSVVWRFRMLSRAAFQRKRLLRQVSFLKVAQTLPNPGVSLCSSSALPSDVPSKMFPSKRHVSHDFCSMKFLTGPGYAACHENGLKKRFR